MKFPRSARLHSRREYQLIQKAGKRLVGKLLCVDYRWGPKETPRLGITASSKFGDSHERNRFKRIVREAFRSTLSQLPARLELNVVPRQRAKEACTQGVLAELISLLKGLMNAQHPPK